MIATSTPELKRLIDDEEMINIRKNRAKGTKRKLSIGVNQTLLSSSSSDSECDMVGLLDDSSDDLLHHSDEDHTMWALCMMIQINMNWKLNSLERTTPVDLFFPVKMMCPPCHRRTLLRGYQNRIVQEALPEQRKQYNLALI